jgi:hypothetical protein
MAMAERRNIEFGVEGGVTLRGWLFVPGAKTPAPAITMAHELCRREGARPRTIRTGLRGSRFRRAAP